MLFLPDDPDEAAVELKKFTADQLAQYQEMIEMIATQEAAAMNIADGIDECMTIDEIQMEARKAMVCIRSFSGELVS